MCMQKPLQPFIPSSGLHQVLQVADRLAVQIGASVAVPDVFQGQPWTMERMPPKPEDNFRDWLTVKHSYEALAPILAAAKKMLAEKYNASKFACIGFCWGAWIAMQAGQVCDNRLTTMTCSGLSFAFCIQSTLTNCTYTLVHAPGPNLLLRRRCTPYPF